MAKHFHQSFIVIPALSMLILRDPFIKRKADTAEVASPDSDFKSNKR